MDVSPDFDPMLGRTIAGYEIGNLIGRGAMGTVYRGHHPTLGRPAAVKVLLGDQTSDIAARFAREARTAAAVSHPNVVQIYDAGRFEGGLHLVFELVIGQSLHELLSASTSGRLGQARLVPLLLQALDGLAAIGDAGLVHRDIKPANLMLTPMGQLKITDFGIARAVASDDLTATGQLIGTPAFMAPEQWSGGSLDHRADQYGLGVTAYVALTGTNPYPGSNAMEVLDRIRDSSPPPPHHLDTRITEAVSLVVMRMMSRDREARFADARACIRALREALEVRPAPSAPSAPVQEPARNQTRSTTTTFRSSPPPPPQPQSLRPATATIPRIDPKATHATSRKRNSQILEPLADDPLSVAGRLDQAGRTEAALDILYAAVQHEQDRSLRQAFFSRISMLRRTIARRQLEGVIARARTALGNGELGMAETQCERIPELLAQCQIDPFDRDLEGEGEALISAVRSRRLRQRILLAAGILLAASTLVGVMMLTQHGPQR